MGSVKRDFGSQTRRRAAARDDGRHNEVPRCAVLRNAPLRGSALKQEAGSGERVSGSTTAQMLPS